MNGILAATLMVGGTGLLIGILLGIAGKKFYVEVDERETKVREALPGNNCGGCGYAGCVLSPLLRSVWTICPDCSARWAVRRP